MGIAPSNHGTKGLIVPSDSSSPAADELCRACDQQSAGAAFLQKLNSIGDTVPGPDYTTIVTKYDEVVTPYQSQYLSGPHDRVTDLLIQDRCPADLIEHDQAPNDPVVHRLLQNALDREYAPASKTFPPSCV